MDLVLLSVHNTPPAGHTFSPAPRLFGCTLRSDLPQLASTLKPLSLPGDTVVAEQVHHKLQQKQAYGKHTGPFLPELPPGSYVYAKHPTSSSTKDGLLALLAHAPTTSRLATNKLGIIGYKLSLPHVRIPSLFPLPLKPT